MSETFEAPIGIAVSMMPPCCVERGGVWCFLATFTPSTTTLPALGSAAMTSPSLPRSLPLRTRTRSPLRIFMSDHLRGQRHDAHEPLLPQLTTHRAEDAGTAGLALVVDQHRCVLVEADVAAVGTPLLLLGSDDDALDDITLLDRG